MILVLENWSFIKKLLYDISYYSTMCTLRKKKSFASFAYNNSFILLQKKIKIVTNISVEKPSLLVNLWLIIGVAKSWLQTWSSWSTSVVNTTLQQAVVNFRLKEVCDWRGWSQSFGAKRIPAKNATTFQSQNIF